MYTAVIEGLITCVVGLASFFLMPASAVQTKAWYRPNGWFTDRETAIVVNRVLRDDPSKGDMHNRQAITPRRLWEALKDYDLWPIYLLGFFCFIPMGPVGYYVTLTLKNMGFSTFNTNLLTIPYVSCFTTARQTSSMLSKSLTCPDRLWLISSLCSPSLDSQRGSTSGHSCQCYSRSGRSPACSFSVTGLVSLQMHGAHTL